METFNRASTTVAEYRARAMALAPERWDPDPFAAHPGGPWHTSTFAAVVRGVTDLLHRHDEGLVQERQLLHGKDNDGRPGPNGPRCQDTLSHWLYYQHHPGDERWKVLGQRYWTVVAFLSWRSAYEQTAPDRRVSRSDGRYARATFPKNGPSGLVSEHVLPKKVLKKELVKTRDEREIEALLRLNLCCVVTKDEDRHLPKASHDAFGDPWQRYEGRGFVLLNNPSWTDAEIEALLAHGLLSERSLRPLGETGAER